MAAVIGDVIADHSRLHGMVTGSGIQRDHPRSHDSPYHAEFRDHLPKSNRHRSASTTHQPQKAADSVSKTAAGQRVTSNSGASRFPTPPESDSPDPSSAQAGPQNAAELMATQTQTTASTVPAPTSDSVRQPPSPASDSYVPSRESYGQSAPGPHPEGQTIKVRDLAHIQSLAREDLMTGGNGPGILNEAPARAIKYEISAMPIGDVIEMVAALLTKITSTNDLQHDALHRNATHQQTAANHNNDGTSMSPLSSSVLAFHGKNVPAITIHNYLSRIHKYCPTTYEVFLSLLVYFDRMTERVNSMVVEAEKSRRQQQQAQTPSNGLAEAMAAQKADVEMHDGGSDSDDTDSDIADDDDDTGRKTAAAEMSNQRPTQATYFVVDSFNIHRLIIAGVTCASKFFSDVFYTNSRYAKVGGLPLPELNHLELQFLVLNEFRLSVPVEDLESYGTMLVEFYAREVVAQHSEEAGTAMDSAAGA